MIRLSDDETGMLAGACGPAVALSMRVILAAAMILGAERLMPIASAHVDSCLYHGPSSLDFAGALLSGGGRVSVPTTLNVGALDRSRPDLFARLASRGEAARRLMDSYVDMGCQPTFTCAPYQLPGQPAPGTDVAWAESNAVVFGNSMIGLRTNRYGDLMDICAAITGRVPYAGLHISENRAARAVFMVEQDALWRVDEDLLPALLGHHIGRRTGVLIPVLDGLQAIPVTEDWGKAFGAAAASSGGVAMFHILGSTPEAPNLATATQGKRPVLTERVSGADLMAAHRELTTGAPGAPLGGVSIGTPPRHAARRTPGEGAHVRHDQPLRDRVRPRSSAAPGSSRGNDHPRHLHLLPAGHHRPGCGGHDELGQVGLLRALDARLRRHPRRPVRLRRKRRVRRDNPEQRSWLTAPC
jgi:predicted aconitase